MSKRRIAVSLLHSASPVPQFCFESDKVAARVGDDIGSPAAVKKFYRDIDTVKIVGAFLKSGG
jgi:hypothetical protein